MAQLPGPSSPRERTGPGRGETGPAAFGPAEAVEEGEPADEEEFGLHRLPFYRRVLLLQGPVGPFFRRVADHLGARGSQVTKVNFNSGDDWFYSVGDVIRFSGALGEWPAFLRRLLAEGNYQAVFFFGDCRPVHLGVGAIARAMNRAVWVFEEGYFRPDYVTLERDGVNAFSPLAKLPPGSLRAGPILRVPQPEHFAYAFSCMAWQAFVYFLVMWLGAWRYPHYVHHKPGGFAEALRWVRCALRKWLYRLTQATTIRQIFGAERKKRFFVFALQVHNDSQVQMHGGRPAVQHRLREVLTSFARHASEADWLVVKHHPMDRGHTNYRRIIASLSEELGLAGRLYYVHDVHLPTLFDRCKGLVTVNSTAGLQGLHHALPVITLGRSFYNKPGLTYQGKLDTFWQADWKPDHDLYLRFRAWTIAHTQINTSFYADPTCGCRRGRPASARVRPALDLGSALELKRRLFSAPDTFTER